MPPYLMFVIFIQSMQVMLSAAHLSFFYFCTSPLHHPLRLTSSLPLVSVQQQLLAIVQQRAMEGEADSTLKFALSALWNLTDEMPNAAHNFIQCQGLELYEEVLEVEEPPPPKKTPTN